MNATIFRSWVGRYGRWWLTIGFFALLDGVAFRRFSLDALGLSIAAIGAWGMLPAADLSGGGAIYQRRSYLEFIMRWCGVGAVLATLAAFIIRT